MSKGAPKKVRAPRSRLASLAGAVGALLALGAAEGQGCEAGGWVPIGSDLPDRPGTAPALRIAGGGDFSCALEHDERVRCWGSNQVGQLGLDREIVGDAIESVPSEPVEAAEGGLLEGVKQIALGDREACARLTGGGLRCWGLDQNAPTSRRARAAPVLDAQGRPIEGVRQIALGVSHACALLEDGTMRCWGTDTKGELGDDRAELTTRAAVAVIGEGGAPFGGVRAIALGDGFSCALLDDRSVRCWGYNGAGELGQGVLGVDTSQARPGGPVVDPQGAPLAGVRSIDARGARACALLDGGTLSCWGGGFLGDGRAEKRASAAPVLLESGAELRGVAQVALGDLHGCARLETGGARCWGDGYVGQIGDGVSLRAQALFPVSVVGPAGSPLGGIRQLGVGRFHGCAWLDDGSVRCWGNNERGQLGNGVSGRLQRFPAPEQVLGLTLLEHAGERTPG